MAFFFRGIGGQQTLAYTIGDAVLHSHDAEASTAETSSTKLKTITLTHLLSPFYTATATLRISFDIKTVPTGYSVVGRIYRNGSSVGVDKSASTDTYETKQQDLEFSQGDTIELWARAYSTTVYVRNFRVLGTLEKLPDDAGFVASNS